MADEQLSPEELQERRELARLVAQSLAKGETPADITQQLVNNGWAQADAAEFVGMIALQQHANADRPAAPADDGGGGMGWLLWIGALIGINVCSWLFDWPFWVY